ncbi:MAG: DUF1963 domain-containing protein [Prevotella sp.]|jgi:uncharacterized protein YwqG|nr:DUF1963 domain-containing protein [Prevotella sp.]
MALQMTLSCASSSVADGTSYFWDAPQLPAGTDLYPYYLNEDNEEQPLQFICQLNLAKLPKSELPSKGMLYFFGLIDYYLGYDVPYEFGTGWWGEGSVRAVYVEDTDVPLERQNPYTEDDMIPPHLITFQETLQRSDGMRLLGEPFEDEVSMEIPEGWTLLLQLDSDENEHFSLMFHDMGLLYIIIEEERLKKGDFSNLRAYMTSM